MIMCAKIRNCQRGTTDKKCYIPPILGYRQSMLFVLFGLILTSCAHRPNLNPEGPYWVDNDRKAVPEPEYDEPSLMWTSIDRATFDQTLELLDIDRDIRKISGRPIQALNVNSFDEVPNSSWFTNRQGLPQTRLTRDQIREGASTVGGPDTTGLWEVFRPKIGGVTPGFWIEDSKGNQYVIKFDPKGYPDLSTGAAIMAGRFFYACGYNVPQETIVYWKPEILRIKEGATVKEDGKKRPLTKEDIDEILASINRLPDGSIRSLASLNLGNVKGPSMLRGTRRGDPNDWCPHEHRRELRGLSVLASLVNHSDVKDHNSMDVYIGPDGEGYIRHYLMDFGSTFGSAGYGPKQPKSGHANYFDIRNMFVSIATLGLKKWPWEDAQEWTNPSVAYFESELFHPGKWKPNIPVPPFENLTVQDGYWGAKIVMAFRDDDLKALIDAGQYSDPAASEYLFTTLKERRDKIGSYWFSKVNPLDNFDITSGDDGITIGFDNLLYSYGLETPPSDRRERYKYRVIYRGRSITDEQVIADNVVHLDPDVIDRMIDAFPHSTGEQTPQNSVYYLEIRSKREDSRWSPPVRLSFWFHPDDLRFQLVGIEHPE